VAIGFLAFLTGQLGIVRNQFHVDHFFGPVNGGIKPEAAYRAEQMPGSAGILAIQKSRCFRHQLLLSRRHGNADSTPACLVVKLYDDAKKHAGHAHEYLP